MDRRLFMRALGGAGGALSLGSPMLLGACGGGAVASGPSGRASVEGVRGQPVQAVTVSFDPSSTGVPIARDLLGSNVQWSDNGDNMLFPDGTSNPLMLAQARGVAPTVLRYPGGSQSDVFHWADASNQNFFTGAIQPTTMDTQALLELCESLGADPLFTANIVSGDPAEAQAWLTRTNLVRITSRNTGALCPKVARWELGNEPYLQTGRPGLDLAPGAYAAKLNAFIPALRAVDPTVRLGVPLTTDQRNGVWVTPYQGFTREVLGQVDQDFDFACVHNAYMPYATDGTTDTTALYYAAMAGSQAVAADLAAMRALLAELRPGRTIPLAITEWAPMFSLGGATDALILSPTAGLFAADLVRMLALQDGLEMANHWSLSGNWLFGAISQTGLARAVADALHLAGSALAGSRLAVDVRAPTIATPSLGQVGALAAMPLFEALPTRDGNTVRVLMINKDLARKAQVALDLGGRRPLAATLRGLGCADAFAQADVAGLMTPWTAAPAAAPTMKFTLPCHSTAVLELTMAG
jgi:alpha-N-arabinofuranosidase